MSDEPKSERDQPRIRGLDGQEHVMSSGDPEAVVVSAPAGERSQVRAFGGPAPKSWDDYERGCIATYGGGYRDQRDIDAFHHGMTTVFNLLRAEFPSAEECRHGPARERELIAACEAARKFLDRLMGMERVEPADWPRAVEVTEQLAAAVARVRAGGGSG